MTRIFAFLSLLVHGATFGDEVRIVRKGLTQPNQPNSTVLSNVIRFLASSSHQSTTYAVQSNTWQELRASDSYVHAKLEPPRNVALSGMPPKDISKVAAKEEVAVSEILVPLPEEHEPQHIYARAGTNIVSHTKFSPLAFRELIQEPALKLRGTKVYSEFSRLPAR